MLHPHMVDMIEYAKAQGARIWLNTNGSMFGRCPSTAGSSSGCSGGIDLIEFSMDAADAETYARSGPLTAAAARATCRRGGSGHVEQRPAQPSSCASNYKAPTRVVVSIIRQEAMEGRFEEAIDFWLKEIGVDEVITRKFLCWDDNTTIPSARRSTSISTRICRPRRRSRASGRSSG